MDDTQVQDATLVEEQKEQLAEAETLMSVDSAIKERITKLDTLREELKPVKEMLTSYLDNDQAYRETSEVAKKAAQQKSAIKKQLMGTTQGKDLTEKIETKKEEIAEMEESLSYYLREYQRLTGSNEFEGADGELRQIVYSAKLIRKTNLNK